MTTSARSFGSGRRGSRPTNGESVVGSCDSLAPIIGSTTILRRATHRTVAWLPRLSSRCIISLKPRYDLLSFVVMPSHFHWVFRPREEWTSLLPSGPEDPTPRELIMHSLKRFTARECNELQGKQGTFWQDESYDHCVRDEDELWRIIEYVELNPVKAKLASDMETWEFSSAHDRCQRQVPAGSPLVRQVMAG